MFQSLLYKLIKYIILFVVLYCTFKFVPAEKLKSKELYFIVGGIIVILLTIEYLWDKNHSKPKIEKFGSCKSDGFPPLVTTREGDKYEKCYKMCENIIHDKLKDQMNNDCDCSKITPKISTSQAVEEKITEPIVKKDCNVPKLDRKLSDKKLSEQKISEKKGLYKKRMRYDADDLRRRENIDRELDSMDATNGVVDQGRDAIADASEEYSQDQSGDSMEASEESPAPPPKPERYERDREIRKHRTSQRKCKSRSRNERYEKGVIQNEMKYSDYDYGLLPVNPNYVSKGREYGYSYLPPEQWYQQRPRPPICVTENPNDVKPVYTTDEVAYLKEFDSSRRITPPENINIKYIDEKLNSGR